MEPKIFEKSSEEEKIAILTFLKEQSIKSINIRTKKSGAQQLLKIHPQETEHLMSADEKMHFSGTLDAISSDGILQTRIYCINKDNDVSEKDRIIPTTTVFKIPIELIENVDITAM